MLIPDYPSPDRALDGTELLPIWENGQRQVAINALLALLGDVGANMHVDASLVVRPEDNGGATAVGIANACTIAAALGGVVALSPNTTYLFDRNVTVPTGVRITGPKSAVLKLRNQATTTLTSGFAATSGPITFTVADASQFSVGQSVMFANPTTHVFSPSAPDNDQYLGRQISAIAGNTVTVGAGQTVNAHASGDIMASTAQLLRCLGDNTLEGFSIDGNQANNLYSCTWYASAMVVAIGSRVIKRGLNIHDTSGDAIVVDGTASNEIDGDWLVDCRFDNIGGNGIHYGYSRGMFVIGNRMTNGNMRYNAPLEQGGGAGVRNNHQDGAVIYSFNCFDLLVTANYIENWICGSASGSTDPTILNEKITIVGNTYVNCQSPIEAFQNTKQLVFVGNRCRADFPFGAGAMRFNYHRIVVDMAGVTNNVSPQQHIIADNFIKNGVIYLNNAYAVNVCVNLIDNRDENGSSYTDPINNSGIALSSSRAVVVTANNILGGNTSIYIQNSQGINYSTGIIAANHLTNPYVTCVGGATAAGPITMSVHGNVCRGLSSAVKEDGVTALPHTSGTWFGISCLQGMMIYGNRVETDLPTVTPFYKADPTAYYNRRDNMVNGAFELPPAFASDSAAATGGVPVGARYLNGSVMQVRAA